MFFQADIKHLPIADSSIDLIFTDPPYVKDLIHTYKWLAHEAARVLKPGKFVLAMAGGNHKNKIMRWFDDAGLKYFWDYQLQTLDKACQVWKHAPGLPNTTVTASVKSVIAYSKGLALPRTATAGLYKSGGGNDKRFHHWGQSIDSHRYYIDCFSHKGDLVLDPFVGGGTTAEACKILERRYICSDIDPIALQTSVTRSAAIGGPLPLFNLLSQEALI